MNAPSEALQTAFMEAGPDDQPDIDAHLSAPEAAPEGEPDFDAAPPALLDQGQFYEQTFLLVHVVGSGAASATTGREVDLVTVAQSDQGQMASQAIYRLLDRYDLTRRWFLSPGSSQLMDLAMVFAYGQAIMGAIRNAPVAGQE